MRSFVFIICLAIVWSLAITDGQLAKQNVLVPAEKSGQGVSDIVIDIDGLIYTIAKLVAKIIGSVYGVPGLDAIVDIIHQAFNGTSLVFHQKDYWSRVRENVMQVVGDSINEHNMHQVEVYKDDLAVLLTRFVHAPNVSVHHTYPDKNTIADSLSTSIISHRYLVEAAERPESMVLHFADLAALHVLVLKTSAEIYSFPNSPPSRWWVDLEANLDHYISYGRMIHGRVLQWRNRQISCHYEAASKGCLAIEWLPWVTCYETWTVEDKVVKQSHSCRSLHGRDECANHCVAYQIAVDRQTTLWLQDRLQSSVEAWLSLRSIAHRMAANASSEYVSKMLYSSHQ